jgi:hypothetical protein
MRRLMTFCLTVAFVGCARVEEAPPPPPDPLLAYAGKWNVQVLREGSDAVVTTYELNVTADGKEWSMTFPGRGPVPITVRAQGDTIMTSAGPYLSALRNNVMVTTSGWIVMQDGAIVGSNVARYAVTTADSVANFRSRGTRAP